MSDNGTADCNGHHVRGSSVDDEYADRICSADNAAETRPSLASDVITANSALVAAPKLYWSRWLMLSLFTCSSMTNAYQWIHLNIINDKITIYYNESLPSSLYMKEVAVDWLSMVYMLAYIPLIFPSTWLLNCKGLRAVSIAGTFLNAIGAWLKCAAVRPDLFPVLMLAQTVCAIAQVFLLGLPAHLAAVWFGPNEVSTATAIGVFGNQLGCALGFLIPPEIVTNSNEIESIHSRLLILLYGGAGITTLLFVLVVIFFRSRPPSHPSIAQAFAVNICLVEERTYATSLKRLICNHAFVLLLVTYGLNTGSYYAIGTLLNPVILHYFPGETVSAGRVGLTLVIAGVFGSILSGIWLDRTKCFRVTTIAIYVMSFAAMIIFTVTLTLHRLWIVFVFSGFLGFFMTGYLPVGFEFAAELTFPESEGTSSGLLNASAQVFGIILTLVTRAISANMSNGILTGNLLISVILFLGALGTAFIKADLRRQKAQQQQSKLINDKLIASGDAATVVVESTTMDVDGGIPP